MAVGDWPVGAHIEIQYGRLNQLDTGQAGIADVFYQVVLPSGARVLNGGRVDLTPFHFVADDTLSIASQAAALVLALAVYEGIDVRLATTTVHPNGTIDPYP